MKKTSSVVSSSSAASSSSESSVSSSSSSTKKNKGEYTTYTVKSGDYLSTIASKYGTTTQELMDLNDLTSGTINPGQELKVPANSSNDQNSSSADSSSQGDSDN
nr:LysM peptidoglycan-binding domain-containing protein [Ligilactobacillus ruminis]